MSNEVLPKTDIKLVKRKKKGKSDIMIKVPKSELITEGISEKYQKSTTSAAHHKYISTVYNMCMLEVARESGFDPAGAWT